ncbi:MAG: alkyl hydroperoxide reductase subunit F, partial [Steroidobacteraceae bacterium]|nr:alkyl hydroperoxide reductase subunit F [Steroidobacteraceae bacterium]
VLAVLHAGGHPLKIDDDRRRRIAALRGPLRFETYVSLSCHNCPDVVQALNLLSTVNPAIEHTMIDGALFPAETAARRVLAVPSVWLDGAPFAQGRMSLDEILTRLDGTERSDTEIARAAHTSFDLLVVGAGPAGAAAAVYAARKGLRTAIVAERIGGQLQDTLGIENFVSVLRTEGPKLAAQLEQQVRSYGVEVFAGQRAVDLRPADSGFVVPLASGVELSCRAVVLATGARWRELDVPGEREWRGRGVAYCPHCDGPLFKGQRVAVVGGGNSGVEAALDLANLAAQVVLFEFEPGLRADAVLTRQLQSRGNVQIVTSAAVTEIHGAGGRVVGIGFHDRATGEQRRLDIDGVFVQIGLVPNSEWLRDRIALNPRGEIVVDERGATSLPGVFAAGDATSAPYKQIVVAAGDGAKAALGACDYLMRQPRQTQPTAAAA